MFNFFFISQTLSKSKQKLQKKTRECYQNRSDERKEGKQRYGYEKYRNLSLNENQKLTEYRKLKLCIITTED